MLQSMGLQSQTRLSSSAELSHQGNPKGVLLLLLLSRGRRVRLFATPWTAAHQASLSITNFRSLLKLMDIELVIPSNHLILCHPTPSPPAFHLSQHKDLFQ